jgi:hypothetical protein
MNYSDFQKAGWLCGRSYAFRPAKPRMGCASVSELRRTVLSNITAGPDHQIFAASLLEPTPTLGIFTVNRSTAYRVAASGQLERAAAIAPARIGKNEAMLENLSARPALAADEKDSMHECPRFLQSGTSKLTLKEVPEIRDLFNFIFVAEDWNGSQRKRSDVLVQTLYIHLPMAQSRSRRVARPHSTIGPRSVSRVRTSKRGHHATSFREG